MMPTEMVILASATFRGWFKARETSRGRDDLDSPQMPRAYVEWLEAEGMDEVAGSQEIAVQTFLVCLGNYITGVWTTKFPLHSADDTDVWSYFTQEGFSWMKHQRLLGVRATGLDSTRT